MNTFPTTDQSIKSKIIPVGQLLTGRSVNGTFHGQFLLSESPYKINVVFVNITTVQKNELVNFHTANKTDKFNFTYQLFNEACVCRFTAPPSVKMSKGLDKWDVSFKMAGYKN